MAETVHILPKSAVIQALDEQIRVWQEQQPQLADAIRETREEILEMPGDWVEKVVFSERTEDGESLMEGWHYRQLGGDPEEG